MTPSDPPVPLVVVGLCFLIAIFDGYDVIVVGTALPKLLAEPGWNLPPRQAGLIGASAGVGMLFGALFSGPVAQRIGRRRLIIASVAWFSVLTALGALAPTAELLALLRLLAGLGLGSVMPTAIAHVAEFTPPHRRQLYNGLMSAGFPLGGILTAGVAMVMGDTGWRPLFLVGMAPAVLILPLAVAFLPESPEHLVARGRHGEAERIARCHGLEIGSAESGGGAGLRGVFDPQLRRSTALFGMGSFCCLLLGYGLNVWLPQIMREAGYPLGSALRFLLLFNLGAATLGTAAATGTQVLIHGYVAAHHRGAVRANVLGVILALGRLGAIMGPLLGGLIADSRLTTGWNFLIFAGPTLIGALAIACAPPPPRHTTGIDAVAGSRSDDWSKTSSLTPPQNAEDG